MSRCFPYPPPGYVRDGIRDEALIESIKLQRVEKAKKEKNKEKKREKREKEKARGSGGIESKKQRHKKRSRDERSKEDQKGDLQKRTEKETEQLEKSSLTEERGNPVGSQTSSDSTLNSNKRQNLSSRSDGRHNAGSIIRIRLPLQRLKDPEVLPSKERMTDNASVQLQVMHEPAPPIPGRGGVENPCSTSRRKKCPEFAARISKEKPCLGHGRPDNASIQLMHEPAPRPGGEGVENSCSTSRKMSPELAVRLSKEKPCHSTAASSAKKPCLSTGASEGCSLMARASVPSELCGSCSPRSASKFRDLIENWVPPPMPSDGTDFDDHEWLFETKRRNEDRRCELDTVTVGTDHANSTSWPRICYLPDADVYALPFTVPF